MCNIPELLDEKNRGLLWSFRRQAIYIAKIYGLDILMLITLDQFTSRGTL